MNINYLIKRFFKSMKEESYKETLKKVVRSVFTSTKINLDYYSVPDSNNLNK